MKFLITVRFEKEKTFVGNISSQLVIDLSGSRSMVSGHKNTFIDWCSKSLSVLVLPDKNAGIGMGTMGIIIGRI
jgi:hypothetical protein